jgi:hypothetical protein
VMGGYKLRSVMNEVFIVPRKRRPGSPFIACRGEGFVIYSHIVMGLSYKGSNHLTESPCSSWDMGSCHCKVTHHIASGRACLSVVTGLICCSEGYVLGLSFLTKLIFD